MIDTIVLMLSPEMYDISDPSQFTPSAQWALTNTIIPGLRSKQNTTKKELRAGIYKPRLTLEHRIGMHGHYENILKIELSLPKLFFGNNFNELRYKDFAALANKLVTVLREMGVVTKDEILAQAPVIAIHYAKNMIFTDGSTPYHYINKIKESHVPLSLDINQTDYRNEGHSYKIHSNAYEVVFYDKIRDLQKAKQSDKRAIEKDSALQLNMFDRLRTNKKFEVLRMEVRLNKRQKIKQLFAKLGIKADLTFKKLFKPAISRKVLLHYIDKLEQNRPVLLDYKTNNAKALLVDLITNNPNLRPKQVFQLYGLKHALDCMNPRELRMMFRHHNARSWNRLMSDVKKVRLQRGQNLFEIIKRKLINRSRKFFDFF